MVAPLLTFPTDTAGWLAFVNEGADAAAATVARIDAELKANQALSAAEALGLLNEGYTALSGALGLLHLTSETHPETEVRDAAEKQVQTLEALVSARELDAELFAALVQHEAASDLSPDATRVLAHTLRDFRRAGVALDPEQREIAKRLADRETELSLEFGRNVRQGRREIKVRPEELAGLPQDFIDERPVDADGLVTLTTDYPDLMPVREYATSRELRQKLIATYNDLAWPANEAVLAELLKLRQQRAELLGYKNWADFETETRMIKSGDAIAGFLEDVDTASKDAAEAEYPLFLERLRQDDPSAEAVTTADLFYLLGALRRERFDVDAQLVRSYLRYERVLPGVLETTRRLLGISFEPVSVATWHEDVRSYDVVRDGEVLGRIHLDMHPREGKFNHAACFPMVPGVVGVQLPEAALLCNFARGLMTHDEVTTFFHEFGHLVHAILATQEHARLSGISTEWDFVEAPSQMLEEWAWDAGVLATFARNDAGEPIPASLVEKMRTADAFGRALETRRQLGHARVSYHLHVDQPDDIQATTEHWYRSTSRVQPLPDSHSYAGFGHLTGYGSCYYTYQWSLVIARDLLSTFGGDLFNPEVAVAYRTKILERGGSMDAADMVEDFLGRPYNTDAYRAWLSAGA